MYKANMVLGVIAAAALIGATLRGEGGASIREVEPSAYFLPAPVPQGTVVSEPSALAAVAADTLRYRREAQGDPGVGPGLPDGVGLDEVGLITTLEWVVAVARADPSRLQDPSFLSRCLDSWRWKPDSAKWAGDIRLTRYLVYAIDGSPEPTAAQAFALYALPDDEAGLTEEEAELRRDSLLRFRYTRQEVSGGVYRPGGTAAERARPLVWLTSAQHEQALMQGTVAVRLPGAAEPQLYNVHRHNGFPYDRTVTDSRNQRRMWYFREVDRVGGWGRDPAAKIRLAPGVAVAGDVYNLGLGRLILLSTGAGLSLVVLADTGGAFLPNLHQLDLYTGVFPDHASFSRQTSVFGDRASAWLVEARPEREGCTPGAAPG